jgi:hypothetical protein
MADQDDTVELTDLEVIQQFSLAVRGAKAKRADVIAALEADLAYLNGARRTPAKAPVMTPAKTPAKAPVMTPAKTPAKAPVMTPAKAPVMTPAKAPVKAPVRTPAKASVKAPAKKATRSRA